MLNSLHLTYITSISRPAYDQFMSCTSNWITRRRAARIIAHQCEHDSWGLILARQFWSYWGHAARLEIGTFRPIRLALEIHGVKWTMHAEGIVRRQVGNWPNAVRFLHLAWSKIREPGQPVQWVDAALDRQAWKTGFVMWAQSKGIPAQGQLEDVMHVDLLGRQVLQVGKQFMLLPMRHVPVEEAYDAPFRVVHLAEDDMVAPVVQIASDGSAKEGRGGFAAILLSPYAPIETAIAGKGLMPGSATNIAAEVRASILGLRMALQLHKSTGVQVFELLTDSMFVVQSLEDDLVAGKHAATVTTLLQVWTELRCACCVNVKWVNSGHLLNELADKHAKSMVSASSRSTRVQYVYALSGQSLL